VTALDEDSVKERNSIAFAWTVPIPTFVFFLDMANRGEPSRLEMSATIADVRADLW